MWNLAPWCVLPIELKGMSMFDISSLLLLYKLLVRSMREGTRYVQVQFPHPAY